MTASSYFGRAFSSADAKSFFNEHSPANGREVWASPHSRLMVTSSEAQAHVATDEWNFTLFGNADKACAMRCLSALIGNTFTATLADSDSYIAIAVKKDGSETYLATDLFGSRPLCYSTQGDSGLAFAETPAAVASLLNNDCELDVQALYHYVFFHMIPSPDSVYKNIQKLPPASIFHWKNGTADIQRYYPAEFSEIGGNNALQQAQLIAGLENSVGSAVSDSGKTGAFLSGGLDSSSVVGMLSRCAADGGEAFTIGFEAKGYDEIPFARQTAEHFGVKLNEHYLTQQEVLDTIPVLAESFGEPFGNSSAVPAYSCARMAKEHGYTRLLAGDGGDELFAGNERYAKQKVFEHYWKLPGAARDALKTIASAIPDAMTPGLLGKPASYIRQASTPLPDRLHTYNYLSLHNPLEVFSSAFVQQVNQQQPYALMRAEYQQPKQASTLNRMLAMDWKFTLADNDLIKVGTACRAAGIEVRYPMLSQELLDLSCQVPSNAKLPGQKLRHFYKESCRGFLPDSTLAKTKQGFGLPFGVWLRDHQGLNELATDSLESLKKRGIFSAKFIDETRRLHREEHAHYYGELVWVMLMLEQWLQKHQPGWSLH